MSISNTNRRQSKDWVSAKNYLLLNKRVCRELFSFAKQDPMPRWKLELLVKKQMFEFLNRGINHV